MPETAVLAEILDLEALDAEIASSPLPFSVFKNTLKAADQRLNEMFLEGVSTGHLVRARAHLADALIVRAWNMAVEGDDCALVAVGGYGRGELHPASDIDLLILLNESDDSNNEAIGTFITFLWDIGLEPGHSVRSVAQCAREAEADITVATNLIETRLLTGSRAMLEAMREATSTARIWPSDRFFEAKLEEQERRHLKFEDTAYRLEPNVKEGPGGLRDLQAIGWVLKRHTGKDNLGGLVDEGYLTDQECRQLMDSQDFLWRIRWALHLHTGRREDRLLFDHQLALAKMFGYEDGANNLAVEQFMQTYYRTIMRLSRLNEMLLQLFHEALLEKDENPTPPINNRFELRRGYLDVRNEDVFRRYPFALLELFLLMAQRPDAKGVRARTIRLVRNHRHLIDDNYRADIRNRTLFMEILRQPHGITHEMRRMNRYGILARYIPAFGKVVGRMQYDLFHAYTVDEHTMMVLRNARRFFIAKHDEELPLANRIGRSIGKPYLLYIACLFHDIAKGRGGDHSQLGAVDARNFCHAHGLSRYDTRLVAWLVQQHLLMSGTAQKQDISDPEIVHEFAAKIGEMTRLNYLYLLTLADIRGTNPTLWNNWKDALLKELYNGTRRILRRGLEDPVDQAQVIRECKDEARRMLHSLGLNKTRIERLWSEVPDEYFLRYGADEIAWHGSEIDEARAAGRDFVRLRRNDDLGCIAIFVHRRDGMHRFALVTSILDQLGLDIVDARIVGSNEGATFDTYQVLDAEGGDLSLQPGEFGRIREALEQALAADSNDPVPIHRRTPRQLKHFQNHYKPRINFLPDEHNQRTIMELTAADRPGLLSQIGQVFADCGVRVRNAKVATIGERAEDVFFVTDSEGLPINDDGHQTCIREAMLKVL
ncbi:MAG: [protein-PII] uridylyltransferase [Gammaproteobacteria bacterium]